ncbi:serine/threonine protein kinase [Paenibacillus sedimenti]|uniref:Serine/threonine protein kinase n=1 Tax=Paenibacillus sedimenti TaxID=2770274 RepID=A0A926KQS6_9BACL|nr:serine/threonine protein kinase [Paenibacillus sedimenti]MBD0381588.1 serine/threonine protein kinase [Paenibacillus sedimenti]
MDDFKLIKFKKIKENGKNKIVIHNPTKLIMIGRGVQGAVFKLSEDRCVKIYVKRSDAAKEGDALKAAKKLPFVPRLYEVGSNYVIMEYLVGPNLKDHLKETKSISESITKQIIMIRKQLKRIGFIRIKTTLTHFIVTKGNVLKSIDHVDGLTMNDPYNPTMFLELKELGLLNTFLEQAMKIDPDSYDDWQKNIDFNKL